MIFWNIHALLPKAYEFFLTTVFQTPVLDRRKTTGATFICGLAAPQKTGSE
jgi:hypothetical protein